MQEGPAPQRRAQCHIGGLGGSVSRVARGVISAPAHDILAGFRRGGVKVRGSEGELLRTGRGTSG